MNIGFCKLIFELILAQKRPQLTQDFSEEPKLLSISLKCFNMDYIDISELQVVHVHQSEKDLPEILP